MIKILFICHGNICRSTMAESVMTYLVAGKNLQNRFQIASAATSREEIGNSPHYGTVAKLRAVGIPLVPHKAVQMTRSDYQKYDFLIGMDQMNIRNMLRITNGDPEHKIFQLLDFGNFPRDIADPWYTGNFDETYDDILEGCEALLDYLSKNANAFSQWLFDTISSARQISCFVPATFISFTSTLPPSFLAKRSCSLSETNVSCSA